MKKLKILKTAEFNELQSVLTPHTKLIEIVGEKIKAVTDRPALFENTEPHLEQLYPAVLVLPANIDATYTVDGISNQLQCYLDSLPIEGDIGFSIGNFFSGDYTCGDSVWNEASICVALVGVVSDYAGTVATATELLNMLNITRILVLTPSSVMALAKDEAEKERPQKHRIKRLCV